MNNIELVSRKLNVMLLLRDTILRFHQCEAPIHFKVSLSSMSLEYNRFMSCLFFAQKEVCKALESEETGGQKFLVDKWQRKEVRSKPLHCFTSNCLVFLCVIMYMVIAQIRIQ